MDLGGPSGSPPGFMGRRGTSTSFPLADNAPRGQPLGVRVVGGWDPDLRKGPVTGFSCSGSCSQRGAAAWESLRRSPPGRASGCAFSLAESRMPATHLPWEQWAGPLSSGAGELASSPAGLGAGDRIFPWPFSRRFSDHSLWKEVSPPFLFLPAPVPLLWLQAQAGVTRRPEGESIQPGPPVSGLPWLRAAREEEAGAPKLGEDSFPNF